jgi:hypothetical protein
MTAGGGETCGVGILDSGLFAAGADTGKALVDSGTGGGDWTIGGEYIIDCCLDFGNPKSEGGAEAGGGDIAEFDFFNPPIFNDSFVFGGAIGVGACAWGIGATCNGVAGTG